MFFSLFSVSLHRIKNFGKFCKSSKNFQKIRLSVSSSYVVIVRYCLVQALKFDYGFLNVIELEMLWEAYVIHSYVDNIKYNS